MAGIVLGALGLMVVTAIPTTVGVSQAISAQKKQNAAQKESEKMHLAALLPDDQEVFCVLVDNQILLDHPDLPVPGHKFTGYYFMYPGMEGVRGLVSTISDDPPMLNWIFVSAEDRRLRHGGKKESVGHMVGSWGWSADERFVVLEGSAEGFVAVREERDDRETPRWAVYYDPDGQLRGRMDAASCVEVKLRRRPVLGMESKWVKDSERDKK